jgi:hypothetical protein
MKRSAAMATKSTPMKIPVFVSAPSDLNEEQQLSFDCIGRLLNKENLEARALGRSDYPTDYPLKEVVMIARRCAGGVILGYSQSIAPVLKIKPGVPPKEGEKPRKNAKDVKFPTPWNQLEAGILFSLRLPLIVFREEGISGGIFDLGSSDVFIISLPLGEISEKKEEQIVFSLQNWAARVREHYRKWE